MVSVLIIGKGPAGISAGIYAKRSGLDVTIIGKDNGALKKAHLVENYYGFIEPILGNELIENGIKQAIRLGINVIDDEVLSIDYNEDYIVTTKNNTYIAKTIIMATGSPRQTPNIKGLKNFEGKGVSYCAVCDAFFYRGKDVVVLGCCDYAMHEAKELVNVARSVTILTNTAPPQGNVPDDAKIVTKEIAEVAGDEIVEKVIFKDGSCIKTDGVFVAYGVAGSSDFAKKLGVITENNKIVVDDQMRTNLPGLFAAGDCIGGVYQIAKAVNDGSIAGLAASKYIKKLNIIK
ncbi:MAG: NAD(P)/FAD-dependent oxidoreductase [Erysipelotrichaceae bacterium]|nr:NAD(P)/FAD-dependent oxidoreductase [Erysipelotrichaceae bacterium]MDD3924011.1 NAD(P)/FAD-dependent oxidoreductase [Erysipelotrichaceae bacterium]MDD4642724.1 NAD(P)/FAD-dependent oxidoreductase [Erysipelotrichaceae bacterium]